MSKNMPTIAILATICTPLYWTSAHAESATFAKIKSTGIITLGYRETSVPFSYLDGEQKPVGFSMDLCSSIVEKIKKDLDLKTLEVKLNPVNSSTRIPLIQNGTIDIECGGTANSLTRQKQVAFSVATFVSQPRWMVRVDSGLKTMADLKGKTVVATQGSNGSEFAQSSNAKDGLGMNITQASDHGESFLMVQTGRASAFIEDNILIAGLRAASREPNSFGFLPGGYQELYYGLMVRREDPEFKALVDKVITDKMVSGEFEKTYAKWFTSPIPPKNLNLEFPLSAALKERIAHPSDKVDY